MRMVVTSYKYNGFGNFWGSELVFHRALESEGLWVHLDLGVLLAQQLLDNVEALLIHEHAVVQNRVLQLSGLRELGRRGQRYL